MFQQHWYIFTEPLCSHCNSCTNPESKMILFIKSINVSFSVQSLMNLGWDAVWWMMRCFLALLSHPGFLLNCRDSKSGCVLTLSGGGRGSDSLGSQFDPAVRRVPVSGSSSLATRPPASPCTRLPAPHRSRSGPSSGRGEQAGRPWHGYILAGAAVPTLHWVKCWLQCRT